MWFFKSENYELSKASLELEGYLTHEKSVFSQSIADDIRLASKATRYSDHDDFVILFVANILEFPFYFRP